MSVITRILLLSDTHGQHALAESAIAQDADVAIHCGNLTQESKISEFRTTVELLRRLQAPLKLAIAGNYDLTLDEPTFQRRLDESPDEFNPELVQETYGARGAVRQLFYNALEDGIYLLDEGTHEFPLQNGTCLRVYASPFTPSTPDSDGGAYQYAVGGPLHVFNMPENVDVVITHSPPHGILDRVRQMRRIGCAGLFAAVAMARPRLHCFGHVRGQWGAQLMTWCDNDTTAGPSHSTAFDLDRSRVIRKRAHLLSARHNADDGAPNTERETKKATGSTSQGFCYTRGPNGSRAQTLFVNAAIQGFGDLPLHPAWVVDIDMPVV